MTYTIRNYSASYFKSHLAIAQQFISVGMRGGLKQENVLQDYDCLFLSLYTTLREDILPQGYYD